MKDIADELRDEPMLQMLWFAIPLLVGILLSGPEAK